MLGRHVVDPPYGLPALVLEYIPRNLSQLIDDSATVGQSGWWDNAVELSKQLLNGFTFLHENGVSVPLIHFPNTPTKRISMLTAVYPHMS